MLGFDIYWFDKNWSILVWVFPSTYSVEQIAAAGSIVPPLLEASPSQRIDIVLVMNRVDEISGTGQLPFVKESFANLHPKVSKCVFVQPSLYTGLILQYLQGSDLPGTESILFAETLEEAVRIIHHYRGEHIPHEQFSAD